MKKIIRKYVIFLKKDAFLPKNPLLFLFTL
nr:MAG TPA: hypothetical protein [Caudoviricetes sp.]